MRAKLALDEVPTATVGRVTAVLDAFLEAGGDLGVTELAAQLGLAKSVVHRVVSALTDAEYLAHDAVSRRYSLGPRAIRLGLVAVGQMRIRERALPYLRELAAETTETATLSLLVGDHRIYAEQVDCAHPVRQSVAIGATATLYLGASGKAMLAFLPPQRVLGAASAAAPVYDHHGDVIASVSVAGVTVRHGPDDLLRFGGLAKHCADRLSAELGYAAPAFA